MKKNIILTMVLLVVFLQGVNDISDYNIQIGQRNTSNTESNSHYPLTKAEDTKLLSGSNVETILNNTDTSTASLANVSPKGVQASIPAAQTTGLSEEQVMSQNDTMNEILNNSISIKEINRKSINLCNPNTIINNKSIDTSGTLFSATGYYISDYIKLNGKNISGNWLASASTPHLAVYDKDFVLLRTVVPTSQNYLYQNGDYYVRAIFRSAVTKPMINYGNTLLAYTPYSERLTNISNVVYVGAQNGCDYTTIQDALNNIIDDTVINPYIIYLMPGTYTKFTMRYASDRVTPRTTPRNISIIGFDVVNTKVFDNRGYYNEPTAEVWTNGTIKNLTFENTTDATNYVTGGKQTFAYAVHSDFGTQKLRFENCVFKSNAGPAIGLGTWQDEVLEFYNCRFESTCNGTYGQMGKGAFFCHTATANNITNQKLIIHDSIAIAKYDGVGARLAVIAGYTGGTYEYELQSFGVFGSNGASISLTDDGKLLSAYCFNNKPAILNK